MAILVSLGFFRGYIMHRWIFFIVLLAAWYIVVFIAARFLSVRVDAALYEISLLALILVCVPIVWLWKRRHRKPGDANEL